MLKCIGIIVNLNKDITLEVTKLLIKLLEEKGIEPVLFGDVAEKLGRPVISRSTFSAEAAPYLYWVETVQCWG